MHKHSITPKKQKDTQQGQSVNKIRAAVKVHSARGRKISSTMWLQRQLNDPFARAAKDDGFLSRAAYKLLEIDKKYNIFRGAHRVLDLGSAPGSWLQVAWTRLHSKDAILVGVDLNEIALSELLSQDLQHKPFFIIGDFRDAITQELIKNCSPCYDLIMSDMSPNRTGSNIVDHLSIVNLLEAVEIFTDTCLNHNGTLLVKIFQGSEQHDIVHRLKAKFKKVQYVKPQASRSNSMESYILAQNYQAQR